MTLDLENDIIFSAVNFHAREGLDNVQLQPVRKKGNTLSVNIFGLSGGLALVLGIFLIDLLMKAPPLG